MRFVFVLLILVLTPSLTAQVTQADLQARLIKKPLYLRGRWSENKLTFDQSGKLLDHSPVVPFTLAGIDIESVQLTPQGLVLEGQRVGLRFDNNLPKRVLLRISNEFVPGTKRETIILKIENPSSGDFTEAMNAIFTENLADFVPDLPDHWKQYAATQFFSGLTTAIAAVSVSAVSPATTTSSNPQAPATPVHRAGGSITAPSVLQLVQPEYNEEARALRYSGKVLIGLRVEADGKSSHMRIVRPIGLGLDDLAVAAVSGYSFKPATQNGSPVAVEVNIEVDFRIR